MYICIYLHIYIWIYINIHIHIHIYMDFNNLIDTIYQCPQGHFQVQDALIIDRGTQSIGTNWYSGRLNIFILRLSQIHTC
jgi:hypothetical protein